jgi:hypothetical protein
VHILAVIIEDDKGDTVLKGVVVSVDVATVDLNCVDTTVDCVVGRFEDTKDETVADCMDEGILERPTETVDEPTAVELFVTLADILVDKVGVSTREEEVTVRLTELDCVM